MSKLARLSVAVAAALCVGSPAGAAKPIALHFRNEAAEVTAASRLVSAYGVVTSTFRTAAHNRAVGGVPNSYHLLDRAIDVARRPGVTHQQIDAALRRSGYNLVESLDEHDHSHFAFAALPVSASVPATPASDTSSPAPSPIKPLPRVAADEHGLLNLDLGVPPQQSAAGGFRPQSPRGQ